jgi:hypothetical protein
MTKELLAKEISRRSWIQSLCGGFGSIGLLGMLGQEQARAATLGHYVGPRYPAKAKHVIFLFLSGGPSQIDMFDPKPTIAKYVGQRPDAVSNFRTERQTGGLMPSPFKFQKHGQSGTEVSELLPEIASVIDDVCVIRSMYTFNPAHTPSKNLIHSGVIVANRPTMGAWISYGLGTENQNLPGFVVLSAGQDSMLGGALWRSGFLPSEYGGVALDHSEPEPDKMIRYLRNKQLDKESQRRQLDLIQSLNRQDLDSFGPDTFLDGRIKAMESAYRLQFEAQEVFDVRKEPQSIREEYGDNNYGNSCLLARRLVENGVRYIHVYPDSDNKVAGDNGVPSSWDDHREINKNYRGRCPDMDRAAGTLIRDLKRRGLLDETLVVWGGEFGRTPVSEGDGRDHDPYGYTMWMAGGGVKPGIVYGATDEFGFKAVENRVSIHDLHATILYLLGVDHQKLTYRYAGRDFRLTDVFGEVVKDIIA